MSQLDGMLGGSEQRETVMHGEVIYAFHRDSWRDLRRELESAQRVAGAVSVVTGNLTTHVLALNRRWRRPVEGGHGMPGDYTTSPFYGIDLATGCGLILSGRAGPPDHYTTRPLLIVAGDVDWAQTDMGQEVIRLRLAGEIPDIPPGHPDEVCGALQCAVRIDRQLRTAGSS